MLDGIDKRISLAFCQESRFIMIGNADEIKIGVTFVMNVVRVGVLSALETENQTNLSWFGSMIVCSCN